MKKQTTEETVLLSVVVPVYNAEKTIEKCIHSITDTNLPQLEILLIDDGSRDRSYSICKELEAADDRIHVLHKPNGGSASARNSGLKNASGKYITFVDSDDTVNPAEYKKAFLETVALQSDVSCFGIALSENAVYTVPSDNKDSIWMTFIKNPVYMHSVCNKFFRMDVIEKDSIRFDEDLTVCEDMLFCGKVFHRSKKIDYLDLVAYEYDKKAGSITSTTKAAKEIRDFIISVNRQRDDLDDWRREKDFYRFFAFRYQLAALRYLADPGLFDIKKYRKYVIDKRAYKDLPDKRHRLICGCANRGIDIVPILYNKTKLVLGRTD